MCLCVFFLDIKRNNFKGDAARTKDTATKKRKQTTHNPYAKSKETSHQRYGNKAKKGSSTLLSTNTSDLTNLHSGGTDRQCATNHPKAIHNTTTSSKLPHRQFSYQPERSSLSNQYERNKGSAFRTPGASLIRTKETEKMKYRNNKPTKYHTDTSSYDSDSSSDGLTQQTHGKTNRKSSTPQFEDTDDDDDDDDDSVWLNAPPTFSSSTN